MLTHEENIAYQSLYLQLKADYNTAMKRMLELEDEKNKAIEKQQHLQTENDKLTKKLEQTNIELTELHNQITILKDEIEVTKQTKRRKSKFSCEDARIIHDSLKKYGGTLSFRDAAAHFNISTSTIQLLMKKHFETAKESLQKELVAPSGS